MRKRVLTVVLALFLVASVGFVPIKSAQAVTCPYAGERPAVAGDAAVQNGQILLGTCYDPVNALAINQEVEQAKQYLISRYTPGSCSGLGLSNPRVDGIEKLNDQFAIKLTAMLKAMPIGIGIASAFRTQQAQQCANPKVTRSNHSRGCAVDLGYDQHSCGNTACQWVLANAPHFGLQLRLRYSPEWNHLEPISCDGQSTGSAISAPETPVSSIADFIRQMLGGQQQSQHSAPPPPPASTGSPKPVGTPTTSSQPSTQDQTSAQQQSPAPTSCTPSYSCTNGTYFYQTSSCTNLEIQKCPYGCDGDSCKLPPAGSGTQGGSSSHPTSTIDLIMAYANPTAVDIATATPIVLNQNIGDIASALGNQASQNGTTQTPLSGTVVLQGTAAQQTFTSTDLAYSPSSYPSQNSTFGILENMKQALIQALNYLKPFGGISQPMYAE